MVGLGVDVIVMGIGMLTRIRSVVVTMLFFVAGGIVMRVHELVLLQNWCIYW